MSVEFEEEKQFNSAYNQAISSAPKGITGWLIKTGIVKDEKGAKNLMIIVSIICFTLAIYFLVK